jgi:ABC-type bacteriocin/lantibiotic exporter with double-glycine peptidase domain
MDLKEQAQSHYIGLTPISQPDRWGCGYACMATVSMYLGVAPEKLTEDNMTRNYTAKPLTALHLVKMARELGLVAFAYQGTTDDLKENLSKGRAVITLLSQRPRTGSFPSAGWAAETSHSVLGSAHWVVVVGMTPRDEIIIYDPAQGSLTMSRPVFLRSWEKERRVCVLAGVPPKPAE